MQDSNSRGSMYKLIHQTSLPDAAVSKYDDLLSRISTEAKPAVRLRLAAPRPTFKRTFLRDAMLMRRLALAGRLFVPSECQRAANNLGISRTRLAAASSG